MDPTLRQYQAPPTTHILTTHPLSLKDASHSLNTFLARAQKQAMYHPSHQLTPQGITFPQAASNTSGADKLRVLGFIAQGLEGEHVESERANEVLKEMGEKLRRERTEGEFSRSGFGEGEGRGIKRKWDGDGKDGGDQDYGQGGKVHEEHAEAGVEENPIEVERALTPMEEESQIVKSQTLSPEEEAKLRREEEKLRKREERKRLKAEKKSEKKS